MAEIKCPLCNNKNFKLILRKNSFSKEYNLVKCEKCGLCFINPMPTKEELSKFYNEINEVPEWQKLKVIKKARKIFNILEQYNYNFNNKPNILEIGASHGFFLNEAKKRGFMTYGVELSKKACDNAKKYFGIDIENADFLQSSFINKKEYFDVVVLLDVLEHLPNQNEILYGINKVLKRKGILILTLPNIDSWEFKICRKYWEWVNPPNHLFYYSPETIKKMLSKHNFKIKHIETYEGDTAGNLLFHIYMSIKQITFAFIIYSLKKIKLLDKIKNLRKRRLKKNIK